MTERGAFKDGPIEQKKAWESKRWDDWKDLWKDQFRPLILSDDQSEDEHREEESPRAIRNWMRTPMVAGENVLGLINLESEEPGFFTEEHAAILQTFANQAGIAMEKAQQTTMVEYPVINWLQARAG